MTLEWRQQGAGVESAIDHEHVRLVGELSLSSRSLAEP
jgi:hypothetical protein